ncbi:hypothetical protein K0T92_16085, partial [Paenibacillus oenotherae]
DTIVGKRFPFRRGVVTIYGTGTSSFCKIPLCIWCLWFFAKFLPLRRKEGEIPALWQAFHLYGARNEQIHAVSQVSPSSRIAYYASRLSRRLNYGSSSGEEHIKCPMIAGIPHRTAS